MTEDMCLFCGGQGKGTCSACDGKGKVGGFLGLGAKSCPVCEGSGQSACAHCQGTGGVDASSSG